MKKLWMNKLIYFLKLCLYYIKYLIYISMFITIFILLWMCLILNIDFDGPRKPIKRNL